LVFGSSESNEKSGKTNRSVPCCISSVPLPALPTRVQLPPSTASKFSVPSRQTSFLALPRKSERRNVAQLPTVTSRSSASSSRKERSAIRVFRRRGGNRANAATAISLRTSGALSDIFRISRGPTRNLSNQFTNLVGH